MNRTRSFSAAALAVVICAAAAQTAPEVGPAPRPHIDLSSFKTVATATKANPKEFNATATSSGAAAGYLGVVIAEKSGKPTIDVVAPDSPAETAGIKEGDVVLTIDGQRVVTAVEARDVLRAKLAGDKVRIAVTRGTSPIEVTATLKPTTKP